MACFPHRAASLRRHHLLVLKHSSSWSVHITGDRLCAPKKHALRRLEKAWRHTQWDLLSKPVGCHRQPLMITCLCPRSFCDQLMLYR